ncbi:hydroxylysine kinase-like isoform X2 [Littorina saxatilis]|uniref:Hydroxylysine kinase n=2 Tax=Littorina saxatilis TaxID=31220 RepID=A0AAN9GHM0_9CAEN
MSGKDQNYIIEKDEGKNSAPEAVIQQPGEVIVPEVADGLVEKIAEEIYGLKVITCKQLHGYDDKNYHIRVSPPSSNAHLLSINPEGYVLKIVNTIDTKRPDILYAQIEFMKHLQKRGIATQEPVPTVKGEQVAFCQFPPLSGVGDVKTHAVFVRTFLPGQIPYDVTLTRDLCYKLGHFQASVTKALEDFSHSFYDTFDCLWSFNNIPKLKEFVHVITDVRNRRLVDDVIDHFTTVVLPRRSEIRAGFIHGDLNDQNILVERKTDVMPNDPDEYVICGVLDFTEVACTHPLYDLGILVAHFMLGAKTFDPLEVGGHILAGYRSVLDLPELELSLLRVTVAVRLVQSLVLGAYNYSLYPDNEYLLTTARQAGWHVLHALWDTPADGLYQMWANIQESYQRRSSVRTTKPNINDDQENPGKCMDSRSFKDLKI